MNDSTPLFSLAFTSVRPGAIAHVVDLWNRRSCLHQHEWCIGVDAGNENCIQAAETVRQSAQAAPVKVVINEGSKTCVGGWNAAAAKTTGKIIIAVADDFNPPQDWDRLLLAVAPSGWEDQEHVVKVDDGYVHNIFVLPILTRKRYERFGYLFYPKYLSLFCDTEFGEVALRDGVVIEANHLLFEHLHPDCAKRPRDGVDMVHASQARWNAGEMLFNFRRLQNFPVDDGPLAEQYAEKSRQEQSTKNNNVNRERYVAYMQVTKDDLCLLDVCLRLVAEGVSDFYLCQPDRYWSGEPVETDHLEEVKAVAEQLRNRGLTVYHEVYAVERFTMPNDTRILIETRLRNECLQALRKLGYEHVLVVDGDELWIPGTLELVKTYVAQGHKAISVRMIPVIGLPGYPVESATDVAVVYVGPGVVFKVCRSPYIQQTIIYKPCIYHFTGTRKDMPETIQKHRRSGHYDDADYDFEGWIKNTLPNIKPGLQNAHMYKPRQIWPVVRDWRSNELESMPENVRKYLGEKTVSTP